MGIQGTSSTHALPDKTTLLDLSGKPLDSMFKPECSLVGVLGRWLSCILGKRFPREVRDDWLRVSAVHQRIVERIFSEPEANPEDKLTLPQVLSLLATSRDCLCAAKRTDMLADAWRYVNHASETLSIIANPEECSELAERFVEWQPSLQENLKDIFGTPLAQAFEKNRSAKEQDKAKIRTHSRQWALINQANLFRILISRDITFVFLVSLICTLLATKFAITGKLHDVSVPFVPLPYLYIAIYGWFGAALSILLAARELRPSAVTFRTLLFSLFLRLALGAGGAFVVYVVVTTPGVLSTTLSESFRKIPGFIALGIAGGFSERLFQGLLETIARRIVPPESDQGPKKVV